MSGKPSRTNWVGIVLCVWAMIAIAPIKATSIKVTLSKSCEGKGIALSACLCTALVMYELALIFSLIIVSSKTPAQHVYSFCSKAEGDRQWRHLHTWWRKQVRFYFPLIAGLSIPLAIFSPPAGEYNPADWFKCTTEHVFEWDQLDDEWYVILSRIFLLYVPALWWGSWAMMFFAFMMYPHYEMIRKLAYEVCNGTVTGEEIGHRYVNICCKIRWFSKKWGWVVLFVLVG